MEKPKGGEGLFNRGRIIINEDSQGLTGIRFYASIGFYCTVLLKANGQVNRLVIIKVKPSSLLVLSFTLYIGRILWEG